MAAAVLLLIGAAGARAREEVPLVADLGEHLLGITTGFEGGRVLLFGTAGEDGDVVVVVRGPAETGRVRRKDRFLGLWINRDQAEIVGAPSFYRIAASRPVGQLAGAPLLDRLRIGAGHLGLVVRGAREGEEQSYREAWLRLKERAGLYSRGVGEVRFVGGRLFRADMDFPANVPTGLYTVEVYLLRDGEVVSAQTTPLTVGKTGVGAEIFDFATGHAALYGVFAVVLAASAGWGAAAALRRG